MLQHVAGVVALACVASVPQSLLVAVEYEGVACWHTPPGTCARAGAPRMRMLFSRLLENTCEVWQCRPLDGLSARAAASPRKQASVRAQERDATAPACTCGARRTARLDTAQLPPTALTQKLPASGCPGARLTQPPSENAQMSDVVCAHVVSGARHVFCARARASLPPAQPTLV